MGSRNNTVVVTGGRSHHGRHPSSQVGRGLTSKTPVDDWSDKSMDGETTPGRIVRTKEVNVEFQDRKDSDDVEYHELEHLGHV